MQKIIDEHSRSALIYRSGLAHILGYMSSRPDIFSYSEKDRTLPNRATKEAIWLAWQETLDFYIALESLRQYHRDFLTIDGPPLKSGSFLVYYASFLAQYRFALEFIDLMERNDLADKLLNEPVPELGLPGDQYAAFKFRFLNVKIAAEFAALEVAMKALIDDDGYPGLRRRINVDRNYIWEMGKGRGEKHTLKNAFTIIKKAGFNTWLPIQKSVAQAMGDIRVRRESHYLVTRDQIREYAGILQPGDIILQRREWHMTNVGLPGFWTHVALFIGDVEKRRAFFDDAETRRWIRSRSERITDLDALLAESYPDAHRTSTEITRDGHPPRVLEALGPGVIFTALEKSATADSIAVLRPRLPRREIAEALYRAYRYSGRPYDYNFDFATDDKIVCSELIYKAYEPSEGYQGLTLPLTDMMGRFVTPPNMLAKLFADETGTDRQQLDLVLFLDGYEKAGKAVRASLGEFAESWKRPKWHIITQPDIRHGD